MVEALRTSCGSPLDPPLPKSSPSPLATTRSANASSNTGHGVTPAPHSRHQERLLPNRLKPSTQRGLEVEVTL